MSAPRNTEQEGAEATSTGAAQTAEFDPKRVIRGPKDGRSRVLHTMLRVKDLDASLRFYVVGLGMKLLERVDIKSKNATVVFVGFNDHDVGRLLELTYYKGLDQAYTHGSGYGHVAVGVPDMAAALAGLEAIGVEISQRPAALALGVLLRSFVKDPDGYGVELVQTRRS